MDIVISQHEMNTGMFMISKEHGPNLYTCLLPCPSRALVGLHHAVCAVWIDKMKHFRLNAFQALPRAGRQPGVTFRQR